MSVKCYNLVEDAAGALRIEPDDVFLLGVLEYNYKGHDMVPTEHFAAILHGQWLTSDEVPEWFEDFLLDVVTGHYVPQGGVR